MTGERPPGLRATRRGFALPLALLLLSVMTAGAVAVLSMGSAELHVLDNQRAQTSAFAVAEGGLERYLARGRITPADTTIAVPGGTARVRTTLLRAATGPGDTAIYVIRSDGVTAGGLAVAQGRRTVAQIAYYLPARFRARAAWTSLSGVYKSGGVGLISGVDACTTDSVAGVSLPTGSYSQSGVADGEVTTEGKPPIEETGTLADLVADIDIDWVGISDPLAPSLTPDVIICFPGTLGFDSRWQPCGSWPANTRWADPNYWPTILFNGSGALPSDGRGTLIVTGDLTFGGGDYWDGLFLVGGRVVDNGNGGITGAVVSGLNAITGQWVTQSSKANGPKNYQFHSCNVKRAVEAHSRLAQIPNAWVDNWTAW